MSVGRTTSLLHHLFPVCSFSDPRQRKELGVMVYNCSCLALDLHRVFSFYWQLHERDYIPSIWSKRVTALYGRHGALELQLNATRATAYVSVRDDRVALQCLTHASSISQSRTRCQKNKRAHTREVLYLWELFFTTGFIFL